MTSFKLFSIFIFGLFSATAQANTTADLKKQILQLAQSYEGQGDPDQSKQKTLEPLVDELVKLNPMPPVKDRLTLLDGAWKQVWGPYEYKNDDGSIDPQIGIKEIYQVVSKDGYYYNVAPYYPDAPDKNREQVGLLRGEFELDTQDANGLRVKFTNYPGVDPRPEGNIWELAPQAEAGTLQNEITIVPTFIVKLFFGGGKLEEVYTDQDMRILYGTSNKSNARRNLYVMTRMTAAPSSKVPQK